jgi:hypothetical protein
MDDDRLMRAFAHFVAWQNYAASELAIAEVTEAQAEGALKFEEAQHMVTNWSQARDKVTVARAQMALSKRVETARSDVLKAYARRKLAAVVYENCERGANLISRELSRRIGRDAVERRAARWQP